MSGIYIHIPFCASKCIYCGFYSVAGTRQRDLFLSALKREIEFRHDYLTTGVIRTLYFGGGTPTLLTFPEWESLLNTLHNHFDLSQLEEITAEGNPEQLTVNYCRNLLQLGINRLSIGVQSFQGHVLNFMGRRHTAQEAKQAVENAVNAGFRNISIDLIYGVSECSDEQWVNDVHTALSLPIQHLSCYALTSEENSILYKQIQNRKHAPIDDEQAARQYTILLEALAQSNFHHYEVSNFAVAGYESKHNASYWNHTPYIGLGPSAHSFNGYSRQWNPASINNYAKNLDQGILYEEQEVLTRNDRLNELILLSLRTHNGINLCQLEQQFGNSARHQLENHFRQHVNPKYFEFIDNHIRLTDSGLWFADGIASDAFVIE